MNHEVICQKFYEQTYSKMEFLSQKTIGKFTTQKKQVISRIPNGTFYTLSIASRIGMTCKAIKLSNKRHPRVCVCSAMRYTCRAGSFRLPNYLKDTSYLGNLQLASYFKIHRLIQCMEKGAINRISKGIFFTPFNKSGIGMTCK